METLVRDPFATKGVEYLIVVAFLLVLPLYWRYLNGAPRLAPHRVLAAQRRALTGWFRLPEAVYYHPGHTWAAPSGRGRVRLGVDDFALKLLGTGARIRLPNVGSRLDRGAPGWALEIGARVFDLPAPVAGRVVARNETLLESPDLIHEDPYGRGWLLEVELPPRRRSLRPLLHGDKARAWLARAEGALRLRMSPEVGAVLQDGGVPVAGIARALSAEGWDSLARDLLSQR
ncbi:MAG TPA: glycine cleavage system protein H [Candidatus Eisenbacteria bacterium]